MSRIRPLQTFRTPNVLWVPTFFLSPVREGVQEQSDDVLNYFPPQEAAMIREEADLCNMSVNAMLADFAKLGYKTAMDEFAKTNPIPTNILGREA